MSAPVTTPPSAESAPVPQHPWSPAVDAYAASQHLGQYLAPLWEATRRTFPAAPITVYVESDPEIPDLRWIIFDVVTGSLRTDESREIWSRWLGELNTVCPAERASAFTLRLRDRN
jgi:hypothetical protein